MSAEFQNDQDRLIADLRATIAEQQDELDALRSDSGGLVTSRRNLLRGAGVVGGIAALAGVSQVAGKPQSAQAIEGHNAKYAANTHPVFVKVVGQKQGAIQGSVTQKGLEGLIDVTYFQQKGSSPRDAATGQATGRRTYDPIVLRKRVDRASPKLEAAFVSNETLTQVLFRFFAENSSSLVVETYNIELTGAGIVSMNTYSPEELAATSGQGSVPGLLEEVTFAFESIQWTYLDGGITAQDSWTAGS